MRLAFLSPDMSALRIGKWSDIQYILTENFQAWKIDLQRQQLAEDFMFWRAKIIHTCSIFSDFKSVYLNFKGSFFQSFTTSVEMLHKSHMYFGHTSGITQWSPPPSSDISLSITAEEEKSLKNISFLINNEIMLLNKNKNLKIQYFNYRSI